MSGRFSASQPTGHIVSAPPAHCRIPDGQNCPAGQSQEVLQGVVEKIVLAQYPPP
jgi:hypothetical protein